jgi:hypothetical protein
VSAGNDSSANTVQNTCGFSPASTPAALTVAASTKADARAYYSNGGPCVDLFAPGGDATASGGITSDWLGTTGTKVVSGTSMASPHVTGTAARYLATNPCATPAMVTAQIVQHPAAVTIANAGVGSPFPLLSTRFVGAAAPPGEPCSAPAAVSAQGGNRSVTVSWQTPSDGGSAMTGYVISRGTASGTEVPLTTVDGTSTSFVDTTVSNGTIYFYRVTAENGEGSSAPSAEVSATPKTSQGAYFALTPSRVLDSRVGTGTAASPFLGGSSRSLQVAGLAGVPSTGVSAVVMNVTVVGPSIAGYVTVWPGGGVGRPNASNLNFTPGQTVPNLVTVGVGGTGSVNLVVSAGSADLVADVVGYYTDGSVVGPSGARYSPQAPNRILDSRIGQGISTAWGPNSTREVSLPGVPADATAVVLNVTATNATAATFATLWPSGTPRPFASNLNVVPGINVPNLVIVGIGANDKVSLYNNAGSIDFIADVVGWYGSADAHMLFTPAASPTRILDSRVGVAFGSPWAADQSRDLPVGAVGPVPGDATAAVMNVTATNGNQSTFVTAYPAGTPRPLASNLNVVAGQTVPNLVMVKTGVAQRVSLYNNAGSIDLIADVVGWFRTEA